MRRVSQTEAADMKGTSRAAICKLSRERWEFFVSVPGGPDEVDIDHPHWAVYMAGGKPSAPGGSGEKRSPRKERKRAVEVEPREPEVQDTEKKQEAGGNRGETSKSRSRRGGSESAGSAPGVVDIDACLDKFTPLSLKELKTQAEVQRLNIEMHARLGELFDRRIFEERMGELSKYIQMFVDLDRRLSGRICQKLDRIGMEREVEAIIGPEVTKIIQDFKLACQRRVKR